ncbi:hypothetical protein FHG87_019122 [Trinorchestia longiramus]|nr:hypothetical protein FHG87_019122 [Trinorchestia longiramus]
MQAGGRVMQAGGRVMQAGGRVMQAEGRVVQAEGRVVQAGGRVMQAGGRVMQENKCASSFCMTYTKQQETSLGSVPAAATAPELEHILSQSPTNPDPEKRTNFSKKLQEKGHIFDSEDGRGKKRARKPAM